MCICCSTFMCSLVDSCMCPAWVLISQPWHIGMALQATAARPGPLKCFLKITHGRNCFDTRNENLKLPNDLGI